MDLHGTRTDPATGVVEPVTFTTNFLWMCQGYYRHEKGYTPDWPGMDDFDGEIVHPQTWPSDIDLSGKQVLVIGSGATAATLVPAIADECEHVTMLQRSPTYFVSRPNVNEVADMLRDLDIPEEWTHEIVRRKALQDQAEITQLSFEDPEMVRNELLNGVAPSCPRATTSTPTSRRSTGPWQQRLAMVPDGDLFKGISSGKASVVTDEIETFNDTGILTKSGRAARRRRDRHGDRLRPERARRHRRSPSTARRSTSPTRSPTAG